MLATTIALAVSAFVVLGLELAGHGGTGGSAVGAIELEGIAGTELMVARSFVGEDAAYKESHFFAHSTYTPGMGSIEGVEWITLVVGDLQDRGRWDADATIGEGGVGRSEMQE